MDYNRVIFRKINGLAGKNEWLDAFGRAGAEWVIIAMAGWFISGIFIENFPGYRTIYLFLAISAGAWLAGWGINWLLAWQMKEIRPVLAEQNAKSFFKPITGWHSYPSDHAMTAFLLFFLGLFFHIPGAWALLPMALWVCWGRVYCAMHYPFDIIGGIATAAFSLALAGYIYRLIL